MVKTSQFLTAAPFTGHSLTVHQVMWFCPLCSFIPLGSEWTTFQLTVPGERSEKMTRDRFAAYVSEWRKLDCSRKSLAEMKSRIPLSSHCDKPLKDKVMLAHRISIVTTAVTEGDVAGSIHVTRAGWRDQQQYLF